MPETIKHLGPFDQSAQRPCPECGRLYFIRYEAVYDDMSLDELVELVRDTSDRAHVELLEDPDDSIRQDAAHALAQRGHPERAWQHPDPGVRRAAVEALEEPRDLRFLLADGDDPTRQRAALLTLQYLVEQKDTVSILDILQTAPPDVRRSAVAHLRHSSGLDAAMLAGALEELNLLEGFVWLAGQGYQPERQIERLVQALSHPDEEVRKRAVSGLGQVQAYWTPAVLDALRQRLENDIKTRYWILKVLESTGPEVNLQPFYPELARILSTENAWHFREAGAILSKRLAAGGATSDLVHMLLPGLTFRGDYQRRLVGDCFRAIMKSGVELGPGQEALLQSMTGDRRALSEDLLVPPLTTYLVQRQNWAELERLLRGGTRLAGHVALCLSQERFDYKPLEPVLNELLNHSSDWVSENCLKALIR